MVVPDGEARSAALELAGRLAALPQVCLRSDRLSAHRQWDLPFVDALSYETEVGIETVLSGEALAGAQRFADGAGHGGAPAGRSVAAALAVGGDLEYHPLALDLVLVVLALIAPGQGIDVARARARGPRT